MKKRKRLCGMLLAVILLLVNMSGGCAMLPDTVSDELTERISDSIEKKRKSEETANDNTENFDNKNTKDETDNKAEYEENGHGEGTQEEGAYGEGEQEESTYGEDGQGESAYGEDGQGESEYGENDFIEKTFSSGLTEKIRNFFQRILAVFIRKPISIAGNGSETDWNEVDGYESVALLQLHSDVKRNPEKDYTVMIYMVGSNLESGNGCASRDIEEMLGSGVDTEKVNVLIYTGGTPFWKNGIPGGQNTVYAIKQGEKMEVASTESPQNMGDSDTLYEFLQFSYDQYPAKHYALICWDHGNGPVHGFGNDENFSYDSLTLGELKRSLEKSPFGQDHKMDWMGYDACMMGTLEAAQAIEEYAEYFIASQETIPGTGWDYHCLNILNETESMEDIAREVIDSYRESEEQFGEQKHPDMTLACIDLAGIPALEEQLEALSVQLTAGLEGGNYAVFAQKRALTKCFGLGAVKDKRNSLDLVDLADMTKKLEGEYSEEVKTLIQALEEAVIYRTSNISDSCGLSVYYPYDNKNYYLNEGKMRYAEAANLTEYQNYLEDFSENWVKGMVFQEEFLVPENTGGESIDIPLSQEQLKTLSSAYYHILADEGDGLYRPVLVENKILPDEEGVLHIPANPQLFYGVFEDQTEPVLLEAKQAEYTENRNTYFFNGMLYNEDEEEEGDVSVSFFVERMNEPRVENIRRNTSFLLHNGKNDIELGYQNYFSVVQKFYRIPGEKDGNSPYTEWELVKEVEKGLYGLGNRFFIEAKPAQESSEKLICQVVLENIAGGKMNGEVIELHNGIPKISGGNSNDSWPMTSTSRDGIRAEYTPWVRLGGKEDAVSYCVECLWQYYDTVDICWFCGSNTISAQDYMQNYEFSNSEYERRVSEEMAKLEELLGEDEKE